MRIGGLARTVRWICSVGSLLTAIAWIGTAHQAFDWCSGSQPSVSVCLAAGRLGVTVLKPHRLPGGWSHYHSLGLLMLPTVKSDGRSTYVFIPLWIPLIPLLGSAVILWSRQIVAARSIVGPPCKSCGYDRAGLPADAKCPECGTASKERLDAVPGG